MGERRELPKPYNWNKCMMEMAFTISKMSKDPSTKVGAIVVSPDRTSISCGYNGFPSGLPDYEDWWENRNPNNSEFCKYDLVSHAEENAISQARTPVEGWSLYVTHFPCLRCARMAAREKIAHVFYSLDQKSVNMSLDTEKVKKLLAWQNITLTQIPL